MQLTNCKSYRRDATVKLYHHFLNETLNLFKILEIIHKYYLLDFKKIKIFFLVKTNNCLLKVRFRNPVVQFNDSILFKYYLIQILKAYTFLKSYLNFNLSYFCNNFI